MSEAYRPVRQYRLALVIASPATADRPTLLWVLTITSAANRGWPDDAGITDHMAAGLPVASWIRTGKIAMIEVCDAEPIGRLPQQARTATVGQVRRHLAAIEAG